MITEDYVSFETAKLLKEKGFDEPFFFYYRTDDEVKNVHHALVAKPLSYNQKYIDDEVVAAPTLQMVIKRLRKEHNIAIGTSVTVDGWSSRISRIKLDSDGFIVDIIDGIDDGNIPNCDTYEEACEAAIQYYLENFDF